MNINESVIEKFKTFYEYYGGDGFSIAELRDYISILKSSKEHLEEKYIGMEHFIKENIEDIECKIFLLENICRYKIRKPEYNINKIKKSFQGKIINI